jgi:hypothetical protein
MRRGELGFSSTWGNTVNWYLLEVQRFPRPSVFHTSDLCNGMGTILRSRSRVQSSITYFMKHLDTQTDIPLYFLNRRFQPLFDEQKTFATARINEIHHAFHECWMCTSLNLLCWLTKNALHIHIIKIIYTVFLSLHYIHLFIIYYYIIFILQHYI